MASNALVMPARFHSSVWDLGNRRGPLAPELLEGYLEEVGRCHILQPCPVGPLGADSAVLVGPDLVLEVAAEGEALTWPGWGRLKLCLHLGLLLSWLDLLLLLLLLLLLWAADLLGRSLHLLLLHLLLLLHVMILCLLLFFLFNLQISFCFQNPSDPKSFTSAARYKSTNISQNLMSSHQCVYTQKCIM